MLHEPVVPTHELASHHIDELTGYANRTWLDETLPKVIEENSGSCGVLFVDLDGLKKKNDAEGHAAGDALIIEAAHTIDDSVRHPTEDRSGDMVGRLVRLSGDELVVLLTGVMTDEAIAVVKNRIQENLGGKSIPASIGAALHSGDIDDTATSLMGRADKAMYVEKAARKKALHDALPRRKRIASKAGGLLLRYAGVDPPRQ